MIEYSHGSETRLESGHFISVYPMQNGQEQGKDIAATAATDIGSGTNYNAGQDEEFITFLILKDILKRLIKAFLKEGR